jgi:hypothetical protein
MLNATLAFGAITILWAVIMIARCPFEQVCLPFMKFGAIFEIFIDSGV